MLETGLEKNINLSGKRVLYLVDDPDLIARQLEGENIEGLYSRRRLDLVSTDTYPTRACFRFDPDFMAQKALTGLSLGNGKWVPEGTLKAGNFGAIVAGRSFGCGSSREHFPWSLKAAGITLLVADSIERICAQNCQNIGLPYIEGDISSVIYKLRKGEQIHKRETLQGLNGIRRDIVSSGGLFSYLKHYGADLSLFPKPQTLKRPMTAPEKIIAAHMDIPFVSPGDSGIIKADRRYSYEIFYPFSEHILQSEIPNAEIADTQSIYLFYDHSVLDKSKDAFSLAQQMRQSAKRKNLTLYDGNSKQGALGICHTVMLDKHVMPGEVILGTDSHTCTLGAVGALPIGIGATEWAAALWRNHIPLTVPSSIRINLSGQLQRSVMAKDIMLYLLSQQQIKNGQAIGKIFEFDGPALDNLVFDEQVVLSNMTVEGGGFSGFVAANSRSVEFITQRRNLTKKQVWEKMYISDKEAEYDHEIFIDVSKLSPFIALPGDPRNSVPLSAILEDSSFDKHIDIAYIGSCTGAKFHDLKAAAEVLEGQRINKNVKLFVQPSSQEVLSLCQKKGYVEIIEEAGGVILPSACGACVNFGPGATKKGERMISSTNRNYPGRLGYGEAFLANPAIVAASAIGGKITLPK